MVANNGYFIIKVHFFNGNKFQAGSKLVNEETYEAKSYRVAYIPQAVVKAMGINEVDSENEYLVMELKNGGTLMFRNSMVEGINCGHEED